MKNVKLVSEYIEEDEGDTEGLFNKEFYMNWSLTPMALNSVAEKKFQTSSHLTTSRTNIPGLHVD